MIPASAEQSLAIDTGLQVAPRSDPPSVLACPLAVSLEAGAIRGNYIPALARLLRRLRDLRAWEPHPCLATVANPVNQAGGGQHD